MVEHVDSTHLPELVDELLSSAREASSRRASHTLHGKSSRHLRQTVIALVAGAALSDHDSPTEATLQVLRGRVVLTSADGDPAGRWEGATGDLVTIPSTRHGLTAQEDSAILLTVATR
jgi:quercetin dioxygenase-like cupin family protein